MTTLAELMTETATSGFAVLQAEDGSTLRVGALTLARLWTRAVDDTVRSGYLERDLRPLDVVLEDGGQDVIRIGPQLRYGLITNSHESTSDDALERLCVRKGCSMEVACPALDTCSDHLDTPLRIVALLLNSGNLARPVGCTDDEAAVVQLSRERRVHTWSEDIARRELEAAGERRVIAQCTASATS